MKKNIVTIAIIIVIVLLFTVAVIVISNEDRKAPIITFNISPGTEITYKSSENKDMLIQYATAVDDKDGDVSESIKIEDIYISSDLATVSVVYVARDKSNNIAKASQVFKYIASQEEIDNQIKLNQTTSETNASTISSASIPTSTKAQETLSVTTTTSTSVKPVLSLTQSEATITQGNQFSVVQYIKDITDDKDSRTSLFTRIIVSGFDTSTAITSKVGDFPMSIYCTDADGNISNTEKFILHVKAKSIETPTIAETKPDVPLDIKSDTSTNATSATTSDTTPVTTTDTMPATAPYTT